jgi:ABC-type sugar transport system substrate-binding protein
MIKKTSIFFVSLLLLVAMFTSCAAPQQASQQPSAKDSVVSASNQTTPTQTPDAPAKIKIGLSVMDLSNPYFVAIANGVKAAADANDIELVVDDPKSDVPKQVSAIENFISSKVNAIIICAIDSTAVESLLKQARESGIKVIAQSTPIENCDVYVSAKNYDMGYTEGKAAGAWIKDKLGGNAEVALLNYPRIPQQIERDNGIKDGIKELAPNAKIVATQSAGNPEEGIKAAETILQANPIVKVFACINDGGALGALSAIEAAGKSTDDVFVGGVDATDEALDKIKKGTAFRATVDIDPLGNGKTDVELALKLIKGETVENPFVIKTKLVDASNIADYVK